MLFQPNFRFLLLEKKMKRCYSFDDYLSLSIILVKMVFCVVPTCKERTGNAKKINNYDNYVGDISHVS